LADYAFANPPYGLRQRLPRLVDIGRSDLRRTIAEKPVDEFATAASSSSLWPWANDGTLRADWGLLCTTAK